MADNNRQGCCWGFLPAMLPPPPPPLAVVLLPTLPPADMPIESGTECPGLALAASAAV